MNSQNITWWRDLVNFSCSWLFSVPHSLFRRRVTFSYYTLKMSSLSVSVHERYSQKRVQWFCLSYQSCFIQCVLTIVKHPGEAWPVTCGLKSSSLSPGRPGLVVYKSVLVNYQGNLAECWGVTCNGLVSISSRWSTCNNAPSFVLSLMRTGTALQLINCFIHILHKDR